LAIEGLNRALVDICSLLILTISLIQLAHNVPCKFWLWGRHHYFGRTGVHRGSVIIALDRALITSYMLWGTRNSGACLKAQ